MNTSQRERWRPEALDRLGESLNPSVVGAAGRVSAVIALKSPEKLRHCVGADDVDAMLADGVTLEYALFTGPSPNDALRFPKAGFIAGNIRDLASFTMRAATPEDAVQRAVEILEQGVQDAAALLRQAVELSDDTQDAITRHLKQPYGEQTLRMAATIIVNALVFHASLAGRHGVKSFRELEKYDLMLLSDLLREWRQILTINYWSIFSIAHDLLRSINPPAQAAQALRSMRATAERLVDLGVSESHDLTGTVFQRLIADGSSLPPSTPDRSPLPSWPTSPFLTTADGETRSASRASASPITPAERARWSTPPTAGSTSFIGWPEASPSSSTRT